MYEVVERMEAGISITVKRALTPRKAASWPLALPIRSTRMWGVPLARSVVLLLCPRAPADSFGPAAWGLGTAESEYRRSAGAGVAQTSRAVLSSVHGLGNGPVPAGRGVGMPDAALFGGAALPSIDWLVVQTRSLLAQRDFALLAELPFVTLNVSIETDLLEVHRRFTRSSASLSGD